MAGSVWGRRDLNPHALRHMILSHACLPVPALPRREDYSARGKILEDALTRLSASRIILPPESLAGYLLVPRPIPISADPAVERFM
jgi:hypothetical protein